MAQRGNRKKGKRNLQSLEPTQPNAAGIDLGSREHFVAGPVRPDGNANVKRFGTTTVELQKLPIG